MRYLVWFLFLLAFAGYGQGNLNTVTLGTTQSPSYTVNVQGTLVSGFNFTASSTASFYLKVSPAVVPVSSGRNVQLTEQIKVSGVVSDDQVRSLSSDEKSSQYGYFDDLGRLVQTVSSYNTPLKNDAVSVVEYPNVSMVNTYLSYPKQQNSTHGGFVPAAITEQKAFYQAPPSDVAGDLRPYSVEFYENSPIERVSQTLGVGDAWASAGRTSTTLSGLNAANEVLQWDDYVSGFPAMVGAYPVYYPLNKISVSIETNEDGQVTKEYVNQRGQKILRRVIDGSTNLDTYSVFSPAGLLMYVIQPEGVARLSGEYFAAGADQQSFLDRWAFQYQYDDEQRVIAKRAPGTGGWTYIVYDQWNRVVLTQDAVQRQQNKYAFTKYDVFNRPIITGVYITTTALSILRINVAASTIRFETPSSTMPTAYTFTSSYPTSVSESDLLSVTYYDNYWFLATGWDAENNNFTYTNITGYPQKTSDGNNEIMATAAGYKTGGKIRVLDSNVWLNAALYYDKKYHVAQTIAETHRGGVLQTTTKFNFVENVEKTRSVYSVDGLTTELAYVYDHANRLVSTTQSINNGMPVMLRANRYNELGQLVEKNIHSIDDGATFFQSEDLRYNIRGWLSRINNSALTAEQGDNNPDLFGMELEYNPASGSTIGGSFATKKYFSGSISAVKWSTNNLKDAPVRKIYGFDYDNFNRLKKAYYATENSGNWTGNAGFFDEEVKGYDGNGNIKGPVNPSAPTVPTTGLLRYGNVQGSKTVIDDLAYNYDLNGKASNRLIGVADVGNALGFKEAAGISEEYQYDLNGNLIFDLNKGISSVVYNHLNLPKTVQITRANGSVDQIDYTYDAVGNKLRKVVKVGGKTVWTTDYVGAVQYDNNQLSFFSISDGRVVANNGGFDYEYYIKDNVNNVRVVYGQAKDSKSYRATMETELASEEENLETGFQNIASRRINPADASLNYTRASDRVLAPGRSALCNASLGSAVGPAKSLRVLTGDAVYMEAYAKYTQVTGSSAVITAAVLGAAVNSAFAIPGTGETATLYGSIQTNAAAAGSAIPAGVIQPKAYLAFIFVDDNYVYQRSGAIGITTDAYNTFEKITRSFTADKNGYLYIYVASESNVSVANVYFDELYVHHQKNTSALKVFQTSDYYPFGLSFNEYQSDRLTASGADPGTYQTELRNRYLFQGKEFQKDLDVNWYNMEARMMDPSLGRFLSIDPKAEHDTDYTPYHYVLNNPVLLVDPTGMLFGTSDYNLFEIPAMKAARWAQSRSDYKNSAAYKAANEVPSLSPAERQGLSFGNLTFREYSPIRLEETTIFRTAQAADMVFPFIGNTSRALVAAMYGDAGGYAKETLLYGLNAFAIPAAAEYVFGKIGGWLFRSSSPSVSTMAPIASETVAEQTAAIVEPVAANSSGLVQFSGKAKAWPSGATPNSIYTYLDGSGTKAVSNYIYDAEGRVSFQVDFQTHGSWSSGHGHNMSMPGSLGSGHLPENHIPWQNVPQEYFAIPSGTVYGVPIGF